MDGAKKNMMKMMCFAVGILLVSAMVCIAETTEQSLMPLSQEAEQIKEQKEAAEKVKREEAEEAKVKAEKETVKVNLPADSTQRLAVKEIKVSGNKLISTAKLFKNIPSIYNASDKSLAKAESGKLYDFSTLRDIIAKPGEPRQVSTRTIEGLTQYVLSVYQRHHYAGIYVYVPSDALQNGELKDGILPVEVLEASVTNVTVKSFDADQNEVAKGYLRKSAVESWSPVKPDKVVNQKDLDDFVNLLNQNPDRYVSAVVTKGKEPNSLAVEYDIYEASPWHWFIQVDNSGTKGRQWSPKLGLINTNLLGIDDTLQVLYQSPWDKGITENYSLYGSYDFPILGPKLRLMLYGGYSQFNVSPAAGPTGFLGNGDFYGGLLRYNALQVNNWFFDITGGMSHERSRTKPSEFPFSLLESDVHWNMWSTGIDIHRKNDIMDTSITFDRSESMGGSSKEDFAMARTDANPDFTIYTGAVSHSQFLDPNRINRVSGTLRVVRASDRLVPAKMTAIGGMYTVRGYKELEVIGDEAVLASGQYEFDIVKYNEAKEGLSRAERAKAKRPFLRKLAPLAFIDYGHAQIKHPITGEDRTADLLSIGVGVLWELGDHFSGGVYYGIPLLSTEETDSGEGRVNVGFMARW